MNARPVSCRNSGFVLVSVLWLLVIMTMAAAAFSLWVGQVRELAASRHSEVKTRYQGISALSQVAYTYMVGAQGVEGVAWPSESSSGVAGKGGTGFSSLEEFLSGAIPKVKQTTAAGTLRLDGRVLAAGSDMRLMVQDRAGLIGLSYLNSDRVFTALADSVEGLAPEQLKGALMDYQDKDDYRVRFGAERKQYQQNGMYSPLNGFLRNPLQIRSVLGWNGALSQREDAWILRTFKIEGGAGVNANTAQLSALELTAESGTPLSFIMKTREAKPYSSVFQLRDIGLGSKDEIPFTIIPAAGFRLWWWHAGNPTAEVYDVQFRALSPGNKAWYINWAVRVALPDELARKTATEVDHAFFR